MSESECCPSLNACRGCRIPLTWNPVKTITARQIETNLSAVLRLVQAGKEVGVTKPRKPIAKLVPFRKLRRKIDWASTWAKVDAIYGGRPARGKAGSQIVREGRR